MALNYEHTNNNEGEDRTMIYAPFWVRWIIRRNSLLKKNYSRYQIVAIDEKFDTIKPILKIKGISLLPSDMIHNTVSIIIWDNYVTRFCLVDKLEKDDVFSGIFIILTNKHELSKLMEIRLG